jgi:uncharacterized membrane protein
MSLYKHTPHPHTPKNVNQAQKEEQQSFNDRIAVAITRALGSMWAAYLFMILALIGFPGLNATPFQYVQWVSQTFIQLVALSIIQLGTQILGRKAELQAEEQYNTTVKSFHDIEQIMQHLDAQDRELERIGQLLEARKRTPVRKVETKEQVL